MAAGGQGAPLSPYMDFILYQHRSRGRIALNIRGIASLTGIAADSPMEKVIAFDTGPGNCLIDHAATHFSQGQAALERNGAWARTGRVDKPTLTRLLDHPYLKLPPPKSLDKEVFGKAFFEKMLADSPPLSPADVVATLTAFTARTITAAIMEFLLQKERYEEIIVSGGGALNPVLMDGLREAFPGKVLSTSDDYDIPCKAKEAVLMAFLASETIRGNPGNIPSVTGASAPVVLGSITPGLKAFERQEAVEPVIE
jgi:anhydro-N-acetylmuramic acid kinase